MKFEDFVQRLQKECPHLATLDSEAAQSRYGACTSGKKQTFFGSLECHSKSDVQAAIQIASELGISVYPISGGVNWGYGTCLPVQENGLLLDLRPMKRMTDFDPELGIITVEPGVTQADLARFLDEKKSLYLVPVTGAGPRGSILGNALERGYGITPYSDHFGSLLSLEAVLADGSLYRSSTLEARKGHAPLGFKYGVGPYVDGLFTQSGCGIVTSITLSLYKRPEIIQAMIVEPKDDIPVERLVEVVQSLLQKFPGIFGGINLMNRLRVLSMMTAYDRSLVGADGLLSREAVEKMAKRNQAKHWVGFGTLYGSRSVVKAARKEARKILKPIASRVVFISKPQAQSLYKISRSIPFFPKGLQEKLRTLQSSLDLVEGRPNQTALPLVYWRQGLPTEDRELDPAKDGTGLLWYAPLIPMRGSSIAQYVEMVETIMRRHGREPLITLTSLSEKCFDSSVPLLFDASSPAEIETAHRCLDELIETGIRKGWIPYRLGIHAMKWYPAMAGSHCELSQRIKTALDPKNVISPGRYTKP